MFDWLRELTKSAEIRQQERITAYVDNQLSEAEQQQIEAQMRADAALRAEIESLQRLKAGLRAMPRASAPRNFLLDPAEFAKPAPAYEARAYPLLRGATAMAGLMFMLLLMFGVLTNGGSLTSAPVAMESLEVSDTAIDEAAETQAEPLPALAEDEGVSASARVEPTAAPVVVEEAEVEAEMEMFDAAADDEAAAEPEPAQLDVAPIEEADPAADAEIDAMAGAAVEEAPSEDLPSLGESIIIVPPTETPAQAKAVEVAPTETLALTLPSPTISAEIQATDEIAEHDVIGTDVAEPPAETVQFQPDAAPAASPVQRLLIGLGVLFVLLLITTLVIRSRMRQF